MSNHPNPTPNNFDSCKVTHFEPFKPSFDTAPLTKATLDSHVTEVSENPRDFPLRALPQTIQEIVRQKHECLNYPQDFAAAAAFHACSTAIGNTYRSTWSGSYEVTTNLFMTLVANPGCNKSEPVKNAYKPIMQRDDELFRQYELECQGYETALRPGSDVEPPAKPRLRKSIVSDTTTEALAQTAADNPRGVCSLVDEQAGWLKNMNRYNSGSDQETWLSIFNCAPFISDRASRKPIRVSSPCIGVLGTIQPAVLSEFARDNRNNNGMTDRFLYVSPRNLTPTPWSRKKLDPSVEVKWKQVLETLLCLDFAAVDGEQAPNYIPFAPEAEERLFDWQKKDVEDNLALNDKTVDGISAKLHIYVLRFALIAQLARYACGEAGKDAIDAVSAENAILLAKYFKQTAIEAAGLISKVPPQKLSLLQKEVIAALPEEFSTSEGKDVARSLNVPERTFEHWLNNTALFAKVSHGVHKKINQD